MIETAKHQSIGDVVDYQAILGEMSEDVRPDFLAGSNGACQLTETELESLDTVYECINPTSGDEENKTKLSERVSTASQNLISLVEGKSSPIVEGGVTFKEVRETLKKIKDSGYFDKETASEEEVPTEAAEESPEVEQQQEQVCS